jgi:hypothetical protein
MSEEKEDGPIATEEMGTQPEEKEESTSINLIDKQILIGEVPDSVPVHEERLQEQNIGIQQVLERSRVSKRKQKRRRTSSYLSYISRQVEKNGNQINKITMLTQSILKQGQAQSTSGVGVIQLQFQSIKQIKSQVSRLQKQVTLIKKDIQRIRTAPGTNARTRKRPFAITIMPKSKKRKSITSTKPRKSRSSR